MTNEVEKLAKLIKSYSLGACPEGKPEETCAITTRNTTCSQCWAKKIIDAGYRLVEPVHLEALGDDEMFQIYYQGEDYELTPERLEFFRKSEAYKELKTQIDATVSANEKRLGQLYRLKE